MRFELSVGEVFNDRELCDDWTDSFDENVEEI